MSDHELLAWIAVGGFTVQVLGLIVLALMLRESQRLTRAVAGSCTRKASELGQH